MTFVHIIHVRSYSICLPASHYNISHTVVIFYDFWGYFYFVFMIDSFVSIATPSIFTLCISSLSLNILCFIEMPWDTINKNSFSFFKCPLSKKIHTILLAFSRVFSWNFIAFALISNYCFLYSCLYFPVDCVKNNMSYFTYHYPILLKCWKHW